MSYAYESELQHAITALQTAQHLLGDDIAAYPTPIAGCDAQFNRLLSDRTRIANTLRALENEPFVPTPRMLEPAVTLSR